LRLQPVHTILHPPPHGQNEREDIGDPLDVRAKRPRDLIHRNPDPLFHLEPPRRAGGGQPQQLPYLAPDRDNFVIPRALAPELATAVSGGIVEIRSILHIEGWLL